MRKLLFVIFSLILVISFVSCGEDELPRSGGEDTVAMTDSETVREIETDELIENFEASWISAVHYNGNTYYYTKAGNITAGKELGRVEYDIKKYFNKEDEIPETAISSTSVNVGSMIYECEGYSSEFRICAYNGYSGGYECYELSNITPEDGLVLSDIMPAPEMIESIIICDNYPNKIGEIIDKDKVIEAVTLLREQGEFTERRENTEHPYSYFIYFNYADGSRSQLILHDIDYASFLGSISLPKEFFGIISENIFASTEDHTKRGGLYSPWESWGYERPDGCYYEMYPMRIINGELRMGYDIDASSLIASDASGDLTREKNDIWYLTLSGDVAHLKIEYLYDPSNAEAVGLRELNESGSDIDEYITLREIAFEGEFTALSVVDGTAFMTDKNRTLYSGGKAIADKVSCFDVNTSGVVYGTANGLMWKKNGNSAVMLAEGDIRAVALGGIYVYYSTADEIRRVRIDGKYDSHLLDFGAISLDFDSYFFYEGNYNGNLAILRENGDCNLLVDCEYLYLMAQGAEYFEVYENNAFFIIDGAFSENKFDYHLNKSLSYWYSDEVIYPTVLD